MYIKKMYGYVLPHDNLFHAYKGLLDYYNPPKVSSNHYTHWVSKLDLKACFICRGKHGEIYLASETTMEKPPIHHNCRCKYLGELHERVRVAFDFPEWYGQNWSDF